MQRTTVRRIYGVVSTTGVNISNILIQRSGRVIALAITITGIAGAATDAYGQVEVSRVNQSFLATNDAQSALAVLGWNGPIASATIHSSMLITGIAVPVEAGDYLYLHASRTGTQPTLNCHITLYILD